MSRTLLAARRAGSVIPANTVAPAISGTLKTGNSIAVTPGTWTGSPVLTYTLKSGANVLVGPGASKATVEAYAFVAVDMKGAITVVESDSVSATAATSNALSYSLSTPSVTLLSRHDADHGLSLSGSAVTAWADQSGNGHTMVSLSSATRPLFAAGGGPNGHDVLDFRDVASDGKNLFTTTMAGPDAARTIFLVADPGTKATGYIYDCGTGAGGILYRYPNRTMWSGIDSCQVTDPGGWTVDAAVFDAGSSKHSINDGTAATGTVGAGVLRNMWLGDYSGSGGSTTYSVNGYIAYLVIYLGAMSDADRHDVSQFLMGWAGL